MPPLNAQFGLENDFKSQDMLKVVFTIFPDVLVKWMSQFVSNFHHFFFKMSSFHVA